MVDFTGLWVVEVSASSGEVEIVLEVVDSKDLWVSVVLSGVVKVC